MLEINLDLFNLHESQEVAMKSGIHRFMVYTQPKYSARKCVYNIHYSQSRGFTNVHFISIIAPATKSSISNWQWRHIYQDLPVRITRSFLSSLVADCFILLLSVTSTLYTLIDDSIVVCHVPCRNGLRSPYFHISTAFQQTNTAVFHVCYKYMLCRVSGKWRQINVREKNDAIIVMWFINPIKHKSRGVEWWREEKKERTQ